MFTDSYTANDINEFMTAYAQWSGESNKVRSRNLLKWLLPSGGDAYNYVRNMLRPSLNKTENVKMVGDKLVIDIANMSPVKLINFGKALKDL